MVSCLKMKKGFSLVEMLIVVSIIGLLSAFTAASFTTSRPKARLAVVQTQMSGLHPYLVICENSGTVVNFTLVTPVIDGKVCSTANDAAVFKELPNGWQYTKSATTGNYRACTNELDTREVVCSETGCVTNTPVTCP